MHVDGNSQIQYINVSYELEHKGEDEIPSWGGLRRGGSPRDWRFPSLA
jgi:hypothetical protein